MKLAASPGEQSMTVLFVTTDAHRYPLNGYLKSPDRKADVQVMSYDRLSRSRQVSASAVVFTDFDRLRHHELVFAGTIFRQFADAGLRVLNDPGRVAQRQELLHRLVAAGINRFRAYPAGLDPSPKRFPVFLKCEAGHDQHFDTLLPDQPALDRELEKLRAASFPLTHMLVIEFANTPGRPGVWRRHAMHRVGDRLMAAAVVTEAAPFVKYGSKGLATEEENLSSIAEIANNPHEAMLRNVFDIAGIDYGRADFGFDGDELSVFEINTNPTLGQRSGSAHPGFRAATHDSMRMMVEAIDALAGGETRSVTLRHQRNWISRHQFNPLPRIRLP